MSKYKPTPDETDILDYEVDTLRATATELLGNTRKRAKLEDQICLLQAKLEVLTTERKELLAIVPQYTIW